MRCGRLQGPRQCPLASPRILQLGQWASPTQPLHFGSTSFPKAVLGLPQVSCPSSHIESNDVTIVHSQATSAESRMIIPQQYPTSPQVLSFPCKPASAAVFLEMPPPQGHGCAEKCCLGLRGTPVASTPSYAASTPLQTLRSSRRQRIPDWPLRGAFERRHH